MKSTRKQRERDSQKLKTDSPHSISASTSSNVMNVSKKSQSIQKPSEKSKLVQTKLVSLASDKGKLAVSKASTSSRKPAHCNRSSNNSSMVAAAQVEIKVCVKSPETLSNMRLI